MFLKGPSRLDILGFDEGLITDFEIRCRRLPSISGPLVMLLGMSHLFTEELMKRVEVDGVFSCSSGGEVAFQMNCDVWMVTFISEEW